LPTAQDESPVEEIDQDNPLTDPKWFGLGEWLAHLPISNGQRAQYFEFPQVSSRHHRVLP
jgi:hypothetical protein